MRKLFRINLLCMALGIISSAQALGSVRICNHRDYKVYVAVAYDSKIYCLDWNCWEDQNKLTAYVQGWWGIESGSCSTPIGESLSSFATNEFFVRVERNGVADMNGTENALFCLNPQKAFKFSRFHRPELTVSLYDPNGTPNHYLGDCNKVSTEQGGGGREPRKFLRFNFDPSLTDYTVNLN